MTLIIPQNGKVFSHLTHLNQLCENAGVGATSAKDEIKQFWLYAERMKKIAPKVLIDKKKSKDIGLSINHVALNRFGLIVGLNSYLFTVENDSLVFLTVNRRELESNELILCEADCELNLWKQSAK